MANGFPKARRGADDSTKDPGDDALAQQIASFQPERKSRPEFADSFRRAPDEEGWPSREPYEPMEQLNFRVTRDQARRFKRMCKDDRRTHGDMLTILMDHFVGLDR